jgi:hypothetical protein
MTDGAGYAPGVTPNVNDELPCRSRGEQESLALPAKKMTNSKHIGRQKEQLPTSLGRTITRKVSCLPADIETGVKSDQSPLPVTNRQHDLHRGYLVASRRY